MLGSAEVNGIAHSDHVTPLASEQPGFAQTVTKGIFYNELEDENKLCPSVS